MTAAIMTWRGKRVDISMAVAQHDGIPMAFVATKSSSYSSDDEE